MIDDDLPGYRELEIAAFDFGFRLDDIQACKIQGVAISFSRPTRAGETLLGLPVAGPRVEMEVIERHFCPGDADDERMQVTLGRAYQRTIWAMESVGR